MNGPSVRELGEAARRTPAGAPDADLVRVLRELSDSAIAARPYVAAVHKRATARGDCELAADVDRVLDRLDGAIADAGDNLGWPA